MKPVSLRFRCFGPYLDEQSIDFAALGSGGLFLICGETGAGKTAILDAMCYALYGRSSGGLRGDLEVMRCKLAGREDETLVEYTFDVGAERWRFVRSLRWGSKRLNDYHNCMVLREGAFIPVFENPKKTLVNEKAAELLGLTYDQFRQVVILPQGQFERLLVSDSQEKENILVSLFHAQRWRAATDEVSRRVLERDGQLKQVYSRIQEKLREYGCAGTAELAERAQAERESVRALEALLVQAEAEAGEAVRVYEAAMLENREFEELKTLENQYAALAAGVPESEAEARALERAGLAEDAAPAYRACREARASRENLARAAERAREQAASSAAALEEVRREREAHQAARPAQSADLETLAQLRSASALYQSLDRRRGEAAAAERSRAEAQRALDGASSVFQRADSLWREAVLEERQAIDAHSAAHGAYHRSVTGALARTLVPGVPCPVCGSPDHPDPARWSEASVTREDLDRLQDAVVRAGEQVRSLDKSRAEAEEARCRAEEACREKGEEAVRAEEALRALLDSRIPGIEDAEALAAETEALARRTEAYEREGSRLTERLLTAQAGAKAAEGACGGALAALAQAEAALAERQTAWERALEETGLGDEGRYLAARMDRTRREKRSAALAEFRAALAGAREALEKKEAALAGREPPALEALAQRRAEAEAVQRERRETLTLQKSALQKLESDAAALTAQKATHDAARAEADADLEFARRLGGRSGVSLQRYVLGVMLTAVTAEANRLLRGVHGGRYQLCRTNEIAGRGLKGGLELEVYDSRSGGRRSVTTLSGGEKFLAALCLAIGLAAVVQAQGGVRMEAMFIDEGFGSLDQASIGEALEVLQGLRRSHGLVGIISHVERLEETISSRIQVTQSARGSRCRVLL